MSERVSRRDFLSLNRDATIGFITHFLAPQLTLEKECFRPPGSGSEFDFLTACNRCGLCVDACPENIITLFTASDGAKLLNTPYINPNEKPCIHCMKCTEVCPTEALSMNFSHVIGYASILQYQCIAYRDVMCDYCVYACPVKDAIVLRNGKPVVNENNCNGCGICVSHCISETKGIKILLDTV